MEKKKIQEILELEAKEENRLDRLLAVAYPEFSRSYLQELIGKGYAYVNDSCTRKPSKKLKVGDRVVLLVPEPEKLELLPEEIPLRIIYEDEDLLVVVKPCGMVVHPSPGHTSGTLVNALLHHIKNLSSIGGVERPGIVHRLDRGTMGLMVVAKRDEAHRSLTSQFKERRVLKLYRALVQGLVSWDHKVVETGLGRHPVDRKRFAVVEEGGKYAKSEFFVKERFPKYGVTLLEVRIHTGRTHQIRVHASLLGHPIMGDRAYGFKTQNIYKKLLDVLEPCHMLLSYKLGFVHPTKEKWLEFEAQDVEPFAWVLNHLRGAL